MRTPKKLSALVRDGSAHYPQSREAYISKRKGEIACCALGAAVISLWPGAAHHRRKAVQLLDQILTEGVGYNIWSTPAPQALARLTAGLTSVGDVVVSLNDNHGLTREEIADQLEAVGL